MKIKKFINRFKKLVSILIKPGNAYIYLRPKYESHVISFGQEGEDLILKKIQKIQKLNRIGFYVDVGAYHPTKYSNTYLFYLMDYKGINIDPNPGAMKAFDELRPNDINLEIGVSSKENKLKYYMFKEGAYNTFSEERAKIISQYNEILDTVEIATYTLEKIFDEYLPPNQVIDLLDIDVEGLDLDVLKSNNWVKYKPRIIMIEDLKRSTVEEVLENEITQFLKSNDYDFLLKTINTLFYIHKDSELEF